MHLVKQVIKVAGKVGVSAKAVVSAHCGHIYLNEIDWTYRRDPTQGRRKNPTRRVNTFGSLMTLSIPRQRSSHETGLGAARPTAARGTAHPAGGGD